VGVTVAVGDPAGDQSGPDGPDSPVGPEAQTAVVTAQVCLLPLARP